MKRRNWSWRTLCREAAQDIPCRMKWFIRRGIRQLTIVIFSTLKPMDIGCWSFDSRSSNFSHFRFVSRLKIREQGVAFFYRKTSRRALNLRKTQNYNTIQRIAPTGAQGVVPCWQKPVGKAPWSPIKYTDALKQGCIGNNLKNGLYHSKNDKTGSKMSEKAHRQTHVCTGIRSVLGLPWKAWALEKTKCF